MRGRESCSWGRKVILFYSKVAGLGQYKKDNVRRKERVRIECIVHKLGVAGGGDLPDAHGKEKRGELRGGTSNGIKRKGGKTPNIMGKVPRRKNSGECLGRQVCESVLMSQGRKLGGIMWSRASLGQEKQSVLNAGGY